MFVIKTAVRLGAVLALGLALAGCLPVTSKTPVGTTAGLGADKALYGTWKGHSLLDEKHQEGFFHFMAAKDGSITVAVVLANGTNDDSWTIYRATAASLGQNHFLNASLMADGGGAADDSIKNKTFPLLYVLKGRTLTIYLLDEDKTKAAVKAGALKGTIEDGDNGDVEITADAAELDAFFAKPESAELFKPMFILKRVD